MSSKAFANFKGADVEVGTISLNPGSIAAASQGTVTGTITGAKQGDQVFMTPQGLDSLLGCPRLLSPVLEGAAAGALGPRQLLKPHPGELGRDIYKIARCLWHELEAQRKPRLFNRG
jgi:hypothetical protein